jgi:uncharacterized protein
MAYSLFLNKDKKLRNIVWVALFMLLLALFLFPLIILSDQFSFEITMLHQLVLIAVVSIICQRLLKKPMADLTGRLNIDWLRNLFFGLILGTVLMAIPALLLTLFGFINWQLNTFAFSIMVSGFSTMLLVALTEELFFRGFIFQRLIQGLGQWPAQLIIAFLFLLTHLNNDGMTGTVKIFASINIFIASLLFGLAYIKTKSLAMPIGMHFMANFMQGPILGFGVSGSQEPSFCNPAIIDAPIWLTGGNFGIEASAFGLLILVLITFWVKYKLPEKWGNN